jgi:Domain of unknown function (DUF4124)
MNKKILLTVFLVISITTMASTVYKWVDEKGRIQYGDKPSTKGKAESLIIKEQRPNSRSLEGEIVDGEYRTWDGTIRINLPHLVQPGAKIEARQISKIRSGLFMSDDFGRIYIVLITTNSKPKLLIDDVIRNFQPSYEVLNRKVVNTVRGRELRLISFRKGGSLLTAQGVGGNEMKKQPLNLIDATTIFLSDKDNDIFEVTAGVTGLSIGKVSPEITTKEEQERLAILAEKYLEEFLAGIEVK